MIISKTPYRISLFGGGTDYNDWSQRFGGITVGAAINQYCYISLRNLPPFFDHKTRVVYSKTENVQKNEQIQHPSVRNCLKFLDMEEGLEIHHDGDLPARSGIGSSSSFTVGMLNALYAHLGMEVSKEKLAKNAIYVEQELCRENVGVQDQIFASFGGVRAIEIDQSRNFQVDSIYLTPEYRTYLEEHFLLGFTGIQRFSSEIAKTQIKRIQNQSNDEYLSKIMDIAYQGKVALSQGADVDFLADLLNRSWSYKKALSKSVSTPYINGLLDKAYQLGALGGKIVGAGGGGFLLLVVPPHLQEEVKRGLPQICAWKNILFEDQGSTIIHRRVDEKVVYEGYQNIREAFNIL